MTTATIENALESQDGQPLTGKGASIHDDKRHRWLSGRPYLWTGFAERAYVFATPEAAETFIAEHPELADCCVVDWN